MKTRVGHGSAFTLVRWTHRADAVGTVVQNSRVEYQNSIGSGERYYAPLRRVFNEIILEDPKIERKTALQLLVKATNDTMRSDGIVPSYLVIRCITRFPAVDSTVPNQNDRMNALEKARNEMATIVAELRVKMALASQVRSRRSSACFSRNGQALCRTFPNNTVDEKQVFVQQGNREVQFSIH